VIVVLFARCLVSYLYAFNQFYGGDKVLSYTWETQLKAGDLLLIKGEYFLSLGDEIAGETDYEIEEEISILVAEKWFLSLQIIKLIHWMVEEWFSIYRKVIPLWLGSDIEKLLQRKAMKKKTKDTWNNNTKKIVWDSTTEDFVEEKKWIWQSLLVFPDIRTLYNHMCPWEWKQWVAFLTSNMTEKQTNEIFWKVKQWAITTLACTGSGIFQDWMNLEHVHIFMDHVWYYKNRQDPRYHVKNVCEKMEEIYLNK